MRRPVKPFVTEYRGGTRRQPGQGLKNDPFKETEPRAPEPWPAPPPVATYAASQQQEDSYEARPARRRFPLRRRAVRGGRPAGVDRGRRGRRRRAAGASFASSTSRRRRRCARWSGVKPSSRRRSGGPQAGVEEQAKGGPPSSPSRSWPMRTIWPDAVASEDAGTAEAVAPLTVVAEPFAAESFATAFAASRPGPQGKDHRARGGDGDSGVLGAARRAIRVGAHPPQARPAMEAGACPRSPGSQDRLAAA